MRPRIAKLTLALAAAALFSAGLGAAPLDKTAVSDQAKWVIHLDMDQFRSGKLGGHVTREILNKKFAQGLAAMNLTLDFNFDKVASITAYGKDFDDGKKGKGALLIKTTASVSKDLDAIAQNPKLTANGSAILKKLQGGLFPLYSIGTDAFAALMPGNMLVLSKSRNELDEALEVVAGKSANLSAATSFSDLSASPSHFLYIALAGDFTRNMNIPPQAKILQNAEGGRLVLGEKEDRITASLSLKGKTAEVAAQIQQIVQGLFALAALAQDGNKDVQQLAQGASVTTADKMVTISLGFPVTEALKKISQLNGANESAERIRKSEAEKKNAEEKR